MILNCILGVFGGYHLYRCEIVIVTIVLPVVPHGSLSVYQIQMSQYEDTFRKVTSESVECLTGNADVS
jgi:hypothetical protein